jgi:hypothetical protein
MAVAGLILLLAGFALVVPRGGISGSAAIRNVEVPGSHIQRTPGYGGSGRAPAGYQEESGRARAQWIRLGLGLALLVLGVVFLLVEI